MYHSAAAWQAVVGPNVGRASSLPRRRSPRQPCPPLPPARLHLLVTIYCTRARRLGHADSQAGECARAPHGPAGDDQFFVTIVTNFGTTFSVAGARAGSGVLAQLSQISGGSDFFQRAGG